MLAHLRACHPRFRFKATWSPVRVHLSLEVSLNEAYDGSNDCGLRRWSAIQAASESSPTAIGGHTRCTGELVGGWAGMGALNGSSGGGGSGTSKGAFGNETGATPVVGPGGGAFRRPVRRLPYTHLIYWRGLESSVDQPFDPTLSVRPMAVGHNRVYYHTWCVQPIRACEFDVDSENEEAGDAPQWLRQHYQRKLEEFTDVNQGEKQLMQAWNAYLLSVRPVRLVVCDSQVGSLVADFVRRHAGWLHSRCLRSNLVLHLANLTDCGLLSPGHLRHCLALFDQLRPLQVEPLNVVSSLTPAFVASPTVEAVDVQGNLATKPRR